MPNDTEIKIKHKENVKELSRSVSFATEDLDRRPPPSKKRKKYIQKLANKALKVAMSYKPEQET